MTVIRVIAGLMVMTVVALTATLAYHVHVEPVGGRLSRFIPEPGSMDPHREAIVFAQSLESRELPDIEPGAQGFRKAFEMLSSGRMEEAREKLTTIFNIFPNSSVAKNARRIVGEMNIDELLGSRSGFGREIYRVRPGDSYLAIAARHQTTVEMMIHLNSMQRLKNIQPGHELIVMPLNFRILIEPRRQAVSIWDEGRFLREYPALSMKGLPSKATQTTIKQKIAELNGGNVPSHAEAYCGANKILQLATGTLQIRGWDKPIPQGEEQQDDLPFGVLLAPEDMEELSLLTRTGNIVEIR